MPEDGARVRLTDSRDRQLEGNLYSFEQDGETRWELRDVIEDRSNQTTMRQGVEEPLYPDREFFGMIQRFDAVGISAEDAAKAVKI